MPRGNQGFLFDVPKYLQSGQKHPMPYPSPFFDLASFYLPPTVKELFRWCRYFFKTNGLVHSVIFKMAEYPVTDILFEPAQSDVEEDGSKKLEKALQEDFDIKSFLIEIGLDRFTYGNAFASLYFPFARYLVCPRCENKSLIDDFGEIGQGKRLDFVGFQFRGTCLECSSRVIFKVEDEPIKQINRVHLVRWNPENIDIEKSSITGITTYYYNIPNKDKKKIISKDIDTLKTIPWLFIQAVKEKKKVKLHRSRIFHFKRADISDGDDEWGMPLVLPVLKDLFYFQVLRKVQETIALEHLVPLRILFPTDNQSAAAPHMTTGLGTWRARIEEEISKWKRDPNHIVIMPIPVGYQQVGGDGKMLMLAQELRQITEQVVSGMTTPQEFVFGGLSWSGSSISLRMLENHFLVYRKELLQFLDFVGKSIANFLNVKPIRITMQEFKMADDIQRKELMMTLNRQKLISDSTLLEEIAGINAKAEVKQMIRDVVERYGLDQLLARQSGIFQAKAQGMATEAQAEAQQRVMERQQRGDSDVSPGDSEGRWDDVKMMVRLRDEMQNTVDDSHQMVGGEGTPMEVMTDPNAVASHYAEELLSMPADMRAEVLGKMREDMPETAALIEQKFNDLVRSRVAGQEARPENIGEEEGPRDDKMLPLPEKLPPRRGAEKAVI